MSCREETDKYICDFCGAELGWEEHTDIHGEIWSCEVCGKNFCSQCLRGAIGREDYVKLMQSGGLIKCPHCMREVSSHG